MIRSNKTIRDEKAVNTDIIINHKAKLIVRSKKLDVILITSLICVAVLTLFCCSLNDDPVGNYIQLLENNRNVFFDEQKETECADCIQKLAKYKDDRRVVPTLISVLENYSSFKVIASAAIALGELKDNSSVPVLRDIIRTRLDIFVLTSAVWALGEIADATVVEDLIYVFMIDHETLEEVKEIVTKPYRDIPAHERGIERINILIARSNNLRETISTALKKIDKKFLIFPLNNISPIIKLLKDKTACFETARLLGTMKDKRAVPHLIPILKKYEDYLDSEINLNIVIWALGEIGDPIAVPAIIDAGKYKYTKQSIAEALGKIGDKRAISYLKYLSRNENPNIRYESTVSLVKIDKEMFLPLLFNLMSDTSNYIFGRGFTRVRNRAAGFLGELNDKMAVPYLIDAIKEDHRYFENGLSALAKLDEEKATDLILSEFIFNKDEYFVSFSISILGEIKDKKSTPFLINILKDKNTNETINQSAILALGLIGDLRALPILKEIAKNKSYPHLAKIAEESVKKIKDN